MLNLIPAPRGSVHMQEGSVKLPETVTVSLGDFAPWCLEAFTARLDGHVEIAENGFITLKKADIAKEGYKLTVTENLDKFEDADKITDYAKMVMQWAVGNGLIKGKSENLLDPQGTATRAEISAMLHRFIEKAKPMQAD